MFHRRNDIPSFRDGGYDCLVRLACTGVLGCTRLAVGGYALRDPPDGAACRPAQGASAWANRGIVVDHNVDGIVILVSLNPPQEHTDQNISSIGFDRRADQAHHVIRSFDGEVERKSITEVINPHDGIII